ncbi:MAG: FAD:protein FMN transferase [Oscillospiraceae bacterium]
MIRKIFNLPDKFKVIIIFIMLSIVFLSSFLWDRNNKISKQEFTSYEFVMSTFVEQVVYGENAKIAIDEINEVFKDFEQKYSYFISDSIISNINKNAGLYPVNVKDDEYDLIKKSIEYSKISDGIFDITVAPIVNLWDVTSKNPRVPSQDDIENLIDRVDYRNIILDDEKKTVFLSEYGMEIDLGGLAKGDATNIARSIYQKHNIKNAYISVGGNIYVHGREIDGTISEIGIRDPFDNQQSIGSLLVEDEIIATSGAYERFFIDNGKRYHHIINPFTGYPSESDIESVSVISKDGRLSDFLSTYLFIKGSDFLKQNKDNTDYSFISVTQTGEVILSDSLQNKFRKD